MNKKLSFPAFRNSIYNLFVLFDLRPKFLKSKDVSLGRCACLGNDVLKLLRAKEVSHSLNIINYQKLRLDGFTAAFTNKANRLGFISISSHIPRRDIQLCVSMQANRLFLKESFNPRYIFMDDFSELTDSEFRLKSNSYTFFSSVSDLEPKFRASGRLENLGLIEQDKLTEIYDNFFEVCFSRWPDTQIFFLHFPTKLDSRSLYRERGQTIRNSIRQLTLEYPRVFAFDCPESLVDFGDDIGTTSFPYHYSNAVYDWFAKEIARKIGSLEL